MAIKIIDVSQYQNTIDWHRVKADGINAVFIRAGLAQQIEPNFVRNVTGAIAAGIPVGVYWFCYALSVADAAAEADKCIAIIKPYKITLPVYYDFEYSTEDYANKYGVYYTKKSRTDIIKTFYERVRTTGYDVGVYSNPDYFVNRLSCNAFGSYKIWLAAWTKFGVKTSFAETAPSRVPSRYNADIWQFGFGDVAGIGTICDLDYGYFDLPDADGPDPEKYAVGGKYRIKAGDHYSNGTAVPFRFVGREYTIMQVRSDKILLGELSSWVRV